MTTPPYATYHAAASPIDRTSARSRVAGMAASGVAVLFLAFDTGMKLLAPPAAVSGTRELGYSPDVLLPLGLVCLVLLALYVVPRTAVLGAILWTGYLGGAVATHVRLENPWFSHILFPTYVAALLWGGLWLRDARVRALLRPAPDHLTHR